MKILMYAAALGALSNIAWAGPLDKAVLHGETDKRRAIEYVPGEEMVFTLSLQGEGEIKPEEGYAISWKRQGDDGEVFEGKEPLPLKEPLVIKTKIEKPGFVHILAAVVDKHGKQYKKKFLGDTTTPEGQKALNYHEQHDKRVFFEGSAGADVDKLETMPLPKDFNEFWEKRLQRLAKVPMDGVIVKEYPSKNPKVKCYTFSVPCAGPRPATGVMTIPVDNTKKYPAWLGVHGYGAHYVMNIPQDGPADKIWFYLNAHGYELGREMEYYDEFYNSIMSNGKTFGLDSQWQNKSTDTAYFGWMMYRIARCLEYIKSRPEWNGRDLTVHGGSMGGLQTIWAAGLDGEVTAAEASIPWCCDMGGRDTLKRDSPTWAVRETETMRYFDPVNLALRIKPNCRVDIQRAGLGDYCCPPSGISILWNHLKTPAQINWVQGSTHGYVPSEKHQHFSLFKHFFGYNSKPDDTRLMYDDGMGDTIEFRFDVKDTTVHSLDNTSRENILNHCDCVELYFSATEGLTKPYYCIEIAPNGMVMDYTMEYPSRKQGFEWSCKSLKVNTAIKADGYSVWGSIDKRELKELGIDIDGHYYFGAFRADFEDDGAGDGKLVDWYSVKAYPEGKANFHLPEMFMWR